MSVSVFQIEPRFVERVWGVHQLAPFYADSDKKIGEVWFQLEPDFPILVKFLFTAERLSVQVHPDDEFARVNESCRGKTEMWHILNTQPGASIALGMKAAVTPEQFQAAVHDNTVEELLEWVPVVPGETYFAEAGTVHAIGAGVTLCEIQQNSDVTYRLYDYGRGRELHIEKGLKVSQLGCYQGRRELPVECCHFLTEELRLNEDQTYRPLPGRDQLLIVLEGEGTLAGEPFRAGQVWAVRAGAAQFELTIHQAARLLRASPPPG